MWGCVRVFVMCEKVAFDEDQSFAKAELQYGVLVYYVQFLCNTPMHCLVAIKLSIQAKSSQGVQLSNLVFFTHS